MSQPYYSQKVLEHITERLEKGLEEMPRHMRGGVRNYVLHGRLPGGFLTALFDGDLAFASRLADSQNLAALDDWEGFLEDSIPSDCWGSRAARLDWIACGGALGRIVVAK